MGTALLLTLLLFTLAGVAADAGRGLLLTSRGHEQLPTQAHGPQPGRVTHELQPGSRVHGLRPAPEPASCCPDDREMRGPVPVREKKA